MFKFDRECADLLSYTSLTEKLLEKDRSKLEKALNYHPLQNKEEKISQESSKKEEDIESSLLKKPTDIFVAKIDAVANKFKNPHSQTIICNILKAAYYFHVYDFSHLAYIFATISLESSFGSQMIETTAQLNKNWYEPLFTSQGTVIKEGSEHHKQLEMVTFVIASCVPLLRALSTPKPFIPKEAIAAFLKHSSTYFSRYAKAEDKELAQLLKDLSDAKLNAQLLLSSIDKLAEKLLLSMSLTIQDDLLDGYLKSITAGDLSKVFKKMNLFEHWLIQKFPLLKKEERNSFHAEVMANDKTKHIYLVRQLQYYLFVWMNLRIHKAQNLGNNQKGDGARFKGRGLVQITGRYHYQEFSKLFSNMSSKYQQALKFISKEPIDFSADFLLQNPELASHAEVAAVIAVGGMTEGKIRGTRFKLSLYGRGKDFKFDEARNIINQVGSMDSDAKKVAEKVSLYAEDYRNAMIKN